MKDLKNLLFVPATKKRLKKVKDIQADAFIFDLEDSIFLGDKKEALTRLNNFFEDNLKKEKEFWIVRVNSEGCFEEISSLNMELVDGIMIPKAEDIEVFKKVKQLLPEKFIIAMIETPLGVVRAEDIISDDSVDAVSFGAEDYTSNTNIQNMESLVYIKSMLILYAKAFKKFAYDTPSFEIKNLNQIEKEVLESQGLGFDGKLAVHPNQLKIIKRIFEKYDFEYMERIVNLFEENKNGVLYIDGKIFEIAHINRFKKLLRKEK